MQALKLFMVPTEKSQGSYTPLHISILFKFSGEETIKLIQRTSYERRRERPHNFWMTVTRLITSLRFSALWNLELEFKNLMRYQICMEEKVKNHQHVSLVAFTSNSC